MTDKRKAEEGALAPWFEAGRAEAPRRIGLQGARRGVSKSQ